MELPIEVEEGEFYPKRTAKVEFPKRTFKLKEYKSEGYLAGAFRLIGEFSRSEVVEHFVLSCKKGSTVAKKAKEERRAAEKAKHLAQRREDRIRHEKWSDELAVAFYRDWLPAVKKAPKED